MKKYNLRTDTMKESDLQRVHKYHYILEILKFIQKKDL